MRYALCLIVCALVFLSCKSDTVGTNGVQSVSGRTTLNSASGYGFSFARGTSQPIPPSPVRDSVDDFDGGFVETGDDPTPIGLCFGGYTSHMFHLVRWFTTYDSARAFYQALSEITDTSFTHNTCGNNGLPGSTGPSMKANQIWSALTRQDKFAKMLIVSDTIISNRLQVTFDWVYQLNGSRRF